MLTKVSYAQLNWKLDNNCANFAFLILDYTTYKFEGGYFAKYPYSPAYDRESIPFTIVYTSPADSGDILYKYKSTNDTLFYGSFWWMGCGEILFPKKYDSAELFTYDTNKVSPPYTIEYYKNITEIRKEEYKIKADSAWQSVEKLSILKEFAQSGNIFRIGLFLYAPAIGMFNPKPAKWIIFLYRGQLLTGVENESYMPKDYVLFQNYPNPFNPKTNIDYYIPKAGHVKLIVYDLLGREANVLLDEFKDIGRHKAVFDGSNYSSGIYFYRIITGNYSETKKLVLLK